MLWPRSYLSVCPRGKTESEKKAWSHTKQNDQCTQMASHGQTNELSQHIIESQTMSRGKKFTVMKQTGDEAKAEGECAKRARSSA